MGVGLKPGLPDGTYTATYRVISADTHIVYGGLVFSIGHAGPAPKVTVAGLIARNESGEATKLAFGAVRALDYVSLALFIGGLAFLLIAWLPGLQAVAGEGLGTGADGGGDDWRAAARAFAGRLRPAAARGGRARSRRERARDPAAGGERSGRLAVVIAERHGHRKHDAQPLRRSVGRAGDRLAGARSPAARDLGAAGQATALGPRPARPRLRLPGDHARAGRPREHPESDRDLLPVRRRARAGGERVGRRDRLPAAGAARGDPRAAARRSHQAAAGGARTVLAARARRR